MAFLKAPPQQPRNVTLQLRVSEQVKARLVQYVEFLKCTESYVVSEALKVVFDRDKEFKEWAERQTTNRPKAQGEQTVMKERKHSSATESESAPKETGTHDLFP
jgi:hypothetical protein